MANFLGGVVDNGVTNLGLSEHTLLFNLLLPWIILDSGYELKRVRSYVSLL